MLDSLLSTKLNIPQVSQKVVHRRRLVERLNTGLAGKLTLVSAPAGYGKTTLVAEWISKISIGRRSEGTEQISPLHPSAPKPPHVCWLSLDKADNDIHRFFSYLIAALQEIDPAIGADIQPILETESTLPIEPLLTTLLNDVANCGTDSLPEQRFVLVLDDYYVITKTKIHTALDFLIDHIPPCMHLVILTRADPPMPLGRLRVQQQLTEVREADLRFTLEETTTFLNDLMGLNLSNEDIRNLESRTEGWIAGLQLAAIALQSPISLLSRADKHKAIVAFSGSHHHLIDYLVQEVLSGQPDEVQSFLLRTSILKRFNASLCNAVLENGDASTELGPTLLAAGSGTSQSSGPRSRAQALLDHIEHKNLFLVPLDEKHQWYRYHHLFADFLRQRLRKTEPENIPKLFVRASQWYESQGMVEQAIEHALTGNDLTRVARLLDENALEYLLNADVSKLIHWSSRIPVRVRRDFPRLCLIHAWALQFEYQLEAVEPELALAEAHLLDPARLPDTLPAYMLTGHARAVRAYVAFRKGEFEQAVALSQEALNGLPEDGSDELHALRSALVLNVGRGYHDLGQIRIANRALREAIPLCLQSGNRFGAVSCLFYLMDNELAVGALNQAYANGQKGLAWIDEWSKPGRSMTRPLRMVAQLRLALGRMQYERNDLAQAALKMEKAVRFFELVGSWLRLRNYLFLVDLRQAQGDVDGALSYLKKFQRFIQSQDYSLLSIPAEAMLAEKNLLLSRLRPDLDSLYIDALTWADSSGLAPDDQFQPELEYEYHVLAQTLLAQGKSEEATPLLERLIQSAERSGRWGHLIGYLSLQAISYHAQDRTDEALTHLSRALTLAEPESYVRTFVDLGPPMRDLLLIAAGRGMAPTYMPTLLITFPSQVTGQVSPLRPHTRSPIHLVEPLTDREVQILRLMAAQLTYREIANELYLSVNTIKWYAKSIYGKLGVSSKADAADRARELNIL
jgi:LuxR family maltose regulon positive regulatory protein